MKTIDGLFPGTGHNLLVVLICIGEIMSCPLVPFRPMPFSSVRHFFDRPQETLSRAWCASWFWRRLITINYLTSASAKTKCQLLLHTVLTDLFPLTVPLPLPPRLKSDRIEKEGWKSDGVILQISWWEEMRASPAWKAGRIAIFSLDTDSICMRRWRRAMESLASPGTCRKDSGFSARPAAPVNRRGQRESKWLRARPVTRGASLQSQRAERR